MPFESEQQRARWEHYAATYEWMFGASDRRFGNVPKHEFYGQGQVGTPGYSGFSAPKYAHSYDFVRDKVFDIPGAVRRVSRVDPNELIQGSYPLIKEEFRTMVYDRVGKFWDDRSYALVHVHEYDIVALLKSSVEYTPSHGWTVVPLGSQEALSAVLRVLAVRKPLARTQLSELACSLTDTRVAESYRMTDLAAVDIYVCRGDEVQVTPDVDGYCYLKLVRTEYRSQIARQLGSSPTLASVMTLPLAKIDMAAYLTHTFEDTSAGLHVEPGGDDLHNCAADFSASRFDGCDQDTLGVFKWYKRGRKLEGSLLVGTRRAVGSDMSLRTTSKDLKTAVEIIDSSIWAPLLYITTEPDGTAEDCVGWAEFVYEDTGSKYGFSGCNVDVLLCMSQNYTVDHRGMQFSTWEGSYFVHLPARTRLRITVDGKPGEQVYIRSIPLVADNLKRWQEYYPVIHPMQFSYIACVENVDAMAGSAVENLRVNRDGDTNLYSVILYDNPAQGYQDDELGAFVSSVVLPMSSEVSVDWLEGFNLDVQTFTGVVGFSATSFGATGYLEMALIRVSGVGAGKSLAYSFQPC